MNFVGTLSAVLLWHYRYGMGELLHAWMNVHWFLYHFFSMRVLLINYFAPFHRMREEKASGFDPQNIIEVLVINTVMRLIGMLMRTTFIVLGIIAEIIAFILGASIIVAAFAAPVLIPASIILGILMVLG